MLRMIVRSARIVNELGDEVSLALPLQSTGKGSLSVLMSMDTFALHEISGRLQYSTNRSGPIAISSSLDGTDRMGW